MLFLCPPTVDASKAKLTDFSWFLESWRTNPWTDCFLLPLLLILTGRHRFPATVETGVFRALVQLLWPLIPFKPSLPLFQAHKCWLPTRFPCRSITTATFPSLLSRRGGQRLGLSFPEQPASQQILARPYQQEPQRAEVKGSECWERNRSSEEALAADGAWHRSRSPSVGDGLSEAVTPKHRMIKNQGRNSQSLVRLHR